MAFSSSDWIIDYTGSTVTNIDSGNGDNLPATTGGTWFVGDILDFYQWLANDFASGDTMRYPYPINSVTPTVYEWLNGWSFGDEDNDYKYLQGGSIVSSGGTILYTNLYSLGAQEEGTQLYVIQNDEELAPWWTTGDIDILIKVKDGSFIQSEDSNGNLVDGGLWVYGREFGDLFDHNFIDLSAGGRSPISINTSPDVNNISGEIYLGVASSAGFSEGDFVLGGTSGAIGKIEEISTNNIYLNSVRGGVFVTTETITNYLDRELQTASAGSTTVSTVNQVMTNFDDITITFGSVTKDINNGEGLKPYEVVIDCKSHSLSDVYEYLKYVVRYSSTGSTYTIQGDDGQEYRNASGSTWIDVKTAPFGTFAGGKFFGARGVWIENMAGGDITNYELIDSNGDTQTPPVLYSLELTGLQLNTEVRVYSGLTSPKIEEIAGVENSTDTFTYVYSYEADIFVDIVIHHVDYVYIRLYDYILTNANSSLPVNQQIDRVSDNPT